MQAAAELDDAYLLLLALPRLGPFPITVVIGNSCAPPLRIVHHDWSSIAGQELSGIVNLGLARARARTGPKTQHENALFLPTSN